MQARPRTFAGAEVRNVTDSSDPSRDRPAPRNVAVLAIADKNPIVRAGLADFIARDDRFLIRDMLTSGAEFIALCERSRIDVGVIGWGLPDMTGGDVLRAIKRRGLPTRVVVYTGDYSPGVLREAVKSGAWGVTSKADDPAVLIETLASVRAGRMSIPYIDISQLATDPLENLTVREQELMRALAKGWTNEQIASRIGISRNTVKYHLKNLYEKIGASNRAQAVAMYLSSASNR
ncbi:MAG: response regulator transcription factor [Alphaproteobacteria bacterium]|nr:response regulator transcription factor [Alphaproteobacteria bacterium]